MAREDQVMGQPAADDTSPDLPLDHPLAGYAFARRTPVFTEVTAPAGLRAAHRVAEGVWGRLVVIDGEVEFTFEDDADHPRVVPAGGEMVIPPQRAHHVSFPGRARFAVEFFR